jgi:hypothetical protein
MDRRIMIEGSEVKRREESQHGFVSDSSLSEKREEKVQKKLRDLK